MLPNGTILHLQRFSTEDGPGLRTSIFFKGCPLSCEWCHNPESISRNPEVHWIETRCIACKTCEDSCPDACLSWLDSELVIDRLRCSGCCTCVEQCPSNALELLGTEITLQNLFSQLIKDQTYFQTSNGGVTATGGEPLLQADFVSHIFQMLQNTGIHTALDTCGLCSHACLDRVLPYTDLVLFDIKAIDSRAHFELTGQHNEIILQSLMHIRDHMINANTNGKLWIRTPLIPSATATKDNILGIASFLADNLADHISRWDLLAFNNLSQDKYRRLSREWKYKDTPLMSSQEITYFEELAKNAYPRPDIIHSSGPEKVEMSQN